MSGTATSRSLATATLPPMSDDFWISSQHELSGRAAVVAEEGESVWLYLTEPGGEPIAADCWLANRVPAPDAADIERRTDEYRERGAPPPAPRDVVTDDALLEGALDARRVRFAWSADGEAVAVWVDEALAGFIAAGEEGYSARLRTEGPWGRPLARELYARLFLGEAGEA